MKKFADRKWGEGEEYRIENLVLLSMKDLKWQIKGKKLKKLIEYFMGLYKVKGIIPSNIIELKLPKFIRIHPVVNMSWVQLYKPQVDGQKILPKLVIIKREKKFKIETRKW